jgi:hypothetical protein
VSLEEVALWVFCLFLLLSLLGRFEVLVHETLQHVAIPSLVFSSRVENVDSIEETFVLTRSGPVLGLVTMWPLHIGNGTVMVPFLVMGL